MVLWDSSVLLFSVFLYIFLFTNKSFFFCCAGLIYLTHIFLFCSPNWEISKRSQKKIHQSETKSGVSIESEWRRIKEFSQWDISDWQRKHTHTQAKTKRFFCFFFLSDRANCETRANWRFCWTLKRKIRLALGFSFLKHTKWKTHTPSGTEIYIPIGSEKRSRWVE